MCIFCDIKDKKIPAEIVFENDFVVAFKDIKPLSRIHILIVPKKHIESINQIVEEDKNLLGEMFLVAKKLAKENDLIDNGYKLSFNVGRGAGQEVDHLHLHLRSAN